MSPHQDFLLDCSFGMIKQVWTLYGIQNVGSFGGLPLFTFGKDASAYPHVSEVTRDFEKAWDFCSGIGALGWGAAHAGMQILGHNDRNWLACAAARLNSSAPIIKGDIQLLATVRIAITNGKKFVGLVGFPCQPFSRQGRQREDGDPRFDTLPALLLASWRLGAAGLLLECVPEARPVFKGDLTGFLEVSSADFYGF